MDTPTTNTFYEQNAQKMANINKDMVGYNQRARNQAMREPANSMSVSPSTTFRGYSEDSHLFAGNKPVSMPSEIDESVTSNLGNLLSKMSKDGKTDYSYYGNYDPSIQGDRDSYLSTLGYNNVGTNVTDYQANTILNQGNKIGKVKDSFYSNTSLPTQDGYLSTLGYNNPTTFQYGLQDGMTQRQVDALRYDILQGNEVLGQGYYDPRTVLNNELAARRAEAAAAKPDKLAKEREYLASLGLPQSEMANYEAMFAQGQSPFDFGFDVEEVPEYTGDWNNYDINDPRLWSAYAANGSNPTYDLSGVGQGTFDDPYKRALTGERALAGSTPVFSGGKLIGYKQQMAMDPNQRTTSSSGYTNPFADPSKPHAGYIKYDYNTNEADWRNITDEQKAWLAANAYGLDDKNVLIPTAKAKDFAGFEQDYGQGYSNLSAKNTTHGVMKYAPMVIGAASSLINPYAGAFMNSAMSGFDPKTSAMSLAGAFLPGLTEGLGGSISSLTGAPEWLGNAGAGAIRGAGMGALGSILNSNGNVLRGAGLGAVGGSVSPLVNSGLSQMFGTDALNGTLGSVGSGVLSNVAKTGLSNLLSNNKFGDNLGQSAVSGALSGLGTKLLTPEGATEQERNTIRNRTASSIGALSKLYSMRKANGTTTSKTR